MILNLSLFLALLSKKRNFLFDNDLKKTKLNIKNKKITNTLKTHEFFYEQSNYKVGASENNLQLDIKINEKELTSYNYFEGTFKKVSSVSNKKFQFFEKLTKNKFKFNIKKKIIYSLSIFGLVIILGLLLFFISQSKKNESTLINKLILKIKKLQIVQKYMNFFMNNLITKLVHLKIICE